ncbi:MAG: Vitamin B12 dependent methionine synthase activation subunit, partial [Clostridiales bacterium]|nr:Vitamin B12 dependent methionine synthase activation subunit [Clostridiales bacterium]
FSPGYGDLPIEVQKEFLPLLDAERRLGITLSDSYLMSPSKSVTAIIGIE